jgi:single-strand DNA-binding protein
MSDGMNKVILLGNLGADPELRYTAAGMPVLNLRLATSESYLDRNKEFQERTEWHTVVVWGPRGEALAKLLAKGSGVCVEGNLRTSSWEKDGVRRYKTEVYAREVLLTGKRATPVGSDAGRVGEAAEAGMPGMVKAPRTGSEKPRGPNDLVDELPY